MRVLVNITEREIPYQGLLLQELNILGHVAKATYKALSISELLALATRIGADAIFCTHPRTLANLIPDTKVDQTVWRGSTLFMSTPIVVGQPLNFIRTTTHGKLLFQIDIRKLSATAAGAFKYDFKIARDKEGLLEAKRELLKAAVSVVDIETSLQNQITSVSFTPIMEDYSIATTHVISLMPDHWSSRQELMEQAWQVVKELCEAPMPKVFHNGCFDSFHLIRYNIIPHNFIYDTEYIWHSWYSELPKALAKIASYLLPDFYYWKNESELFPLEYNAKDTINTARIFIKLVQKAPKWVWKNYSQSCPNIAPVVYTCFEGFLTDTTKRAEARALAQADLDTQLGELRAFVGLPDFNPGSWQQVQALLYKSLRARVPPRAKSAAATGSLELGKVALQHPLFELLTSRIIKYRELKKAIGTYYDARLDAGNRLHYAHRLDGTETSRMACSASSLYVPGSRTKSGAKNLGTQIMNVPYYLKKAMLADPGYLLIDTDKSQSEARCTAYIAACETLREALENPEPLCGGTVRDFYCYTGYKFFGQEFNKKHALRQAVKKIIHGTNYIMGWATFIDSVGATKLLEYKIMVGYRGSLKSFAIFLLGLYHELYPEVKLGWDATVKEAATTGRIVTPDGWTRLVLGDPTNHNVMRSIVAHKSQHFSVVGINEAMWKLFYFVQVESKGEYRLKCQIHDSIVSQAVKEKAEYYARKQEEVMDIPQSTPFGEMRIPLETDISYYWKGEE